MNLVVVTGMSGAGKTIALKTLEDFGYFCIDNMPVRLIPQYVELERDSLTHEKTAIGVDIRSKQDFPVLADVLKELDAKDQKYQILFLDSDDKCLLRRYKETRRSHPLSEKGSIIDGIMDERNRLVWLRERADYVIDTSYLLTRDLRGQIAKIFSQNNAFKNLFISVISFGYKYGIPEDADLVMDVRFLPNPYYVEELKNQTGMDREVREYVMNGDDAEVFLNKLYSMIDFLIPRYISEGKNQLVIAFGCTGGKHRSVTIAETVYNHLSNSGDYGIRIAHRDINR